MFDRLAASLNIAFKWFPMFDKVQKFLSNILRYNRTNVSPGHTIDKAFCGLIYWIFDQTLFARLATHRFA